MNIASPRLHFGALHRELIQARTDPRVEAIARSLHLDLTDESVWQRVLGQAERNYQRGLVAASIVDSVASPAQGRAGHSAAAISAYQAIDRL